MYLDRIKYILDKISTSTLSNFLLDKPIDPWLIKGIIALIKYYIKDFPLLARHYALCSFTKLNIDISAYDCEINIFLNPDSPSLEPIENVVKPYLPSQIQTLSKLSEDIWGTIPDIFPEALFEKNLFLDNDFGETLASSTQEILYK